MGTIISRRIEWDAGHRVLGHEGMCARLHGHRYVGIISVKAMSLDALDRVVDFGVLKKVIGGWINENWDHNMLLNSGDPLLCAVPKKDWRDVFGDKDPYLFESANPTAEVIAAHLFYTAKRLLQHISGLEVHNVQIYETPNGSATFD